MPHRPAKTCRPRETAPIFHRRREQCRYREIVPGGSGKNRVHFRATWEFRSFGVPSRRFQQVFPVPWRRRDKKIWQKQKFSKKFFRPNFQCLKSVSMLNFSSLSRFSVSLFLRQTQDFQTFFVSEVLFLIIDAVKFGQSRVKSPVSKNLSLFDAFEPNLGKSSANRRFTASSSQPCPPLRNSRILKGYLQ